MFTIKYKGFLSFIFAIVILTMSISFTCFGASTQKRVLLVSSEQYNMEETTQIISTLEKQLPNCLIEYQFIDLSPTDSAISAFDDRMDYLFHNTEAYDVIIANGNSALEFVNFRSKSLFPTTPVVACNVDYLLGMTVIKSNPMITGVLNVNSIRANIALIPTLFPNTHKVVAIVNTEGSIEYENYLNYNVPANFKDISFSAIATSKYTKTEIAQILSNLDNNTVLYYFSFNNDKNGNSYTTKEAFSFIKENCDIPIISHTNTLDYGNLGGLILSYRAIGEDTAKIVNEILEGKAPREISPIENSDYDYAFNGQLLKKYNLDKALLPQDSVIVKRSIKLIQIKSNPLLTCGIDGILIFALLFVTTRHLVFKGEVFK